MMQIIYLVADALDTPLHMMENGTVRGCKSRSLVLGPWKSASDVVVCSDELTNKLVSFLFRIKADVWAYLTCEDNGEMKAYVFDGKKWDLKSKHVSKFCEGTVVKTLEKIKSEIRAVFDFRKNNSEWTPVELDLVVGEPVG